MAMDIRSFNSDVSPGFLILWKRTKLDIEDRNFQKKHVKSFNMMINKTPVQVRLLPHFDSGKDAMFSE